MVVLLDLVTKCSLSFLGVCNSQVPAVALLFFSWALPTSAFEIFAHFSAVVIVPVDSSIISGARGHH